MNTLEKQLPITREASRKQLPISKLNCARFLARLMVRKLDVDNDTDCYFFHPEHVKKLSAAELKQHQEHSSQWRYDYEMNERTLEHCFDGKSAFVKLLQDKIVLDFGCFMGGTSVAWQELYRIARIYGFDTERQYAEAADAFAAKRRANCEFTHGFGEHLPYQDGMFDTVISLDVFEHVQDVGECLKECARVLGPQGHIMAIFPQYLQPAEHHLKTTVMPFLHWICSGSSLLELQNSMLDDLGPDYAHFKLGGLYGYRSPYLNGITARKFRKLAMDAGFDIELHVRQGFPRMGRRARRNPVFRISGAINKYLSYIPFVEEITLDRVVMILRKKN